MCKASLPPGGRCRNPGSSLRGDKGPCACGQAGQAQTSAPWAGRAGLWLGSLCCAESLSRGWALGHQQELPDNELPHYLADCHCPQPPSAASPLPWHVPIRASLSLLPAYCTCILLRGRGGAGWVRGRGGGGRCSVPRQRLCTSSRRVGVFCSFQTSSSRPQDAA